MTLIGARWTEPVSRYSRGKPSTHHQAMANPMSTKGVLPQRDTDMRARGQRLQRDCLAAKLDALPVPSG